MCCVELGAGREGDSVEEMFLFTVDVKTKIVNEFERMGDFVDE